jgi:hypothetical protein
MDAPVFSGDAITDGALSARLEKLEYADGRADSEMLVMVEAMLDLLARVEGIHARTESLQDASGPDVA